jgi:hypothetical protein
MLQGSGMCYDGRSHGPIVWPTSTSGGGGMLVGVAQSRYTFAVVSLGKKY